MLAEPMAVQFFSLRSVDHIPTTPVTKSFNTNSVLFFAVVRVNRNENAFNQS